MDKEWRPDADFAPFGIFIGRGFTNQPILGSDIVIAGTAWGLSILNVGIAIWLAWKQTRDSRSPLRSVYVWLIWLSLLADIIMGLLCFLHLNKLIKPSFYFYMAILTCWCIQVQLLLQIIINRIRIIVPDRRFSKMIMIWTAVIVTAINISVFNIWIPARLQISKRYIHVNEIWDRIEKVIYLIIDALLNWYFLRVVKANLINNGLQKYNKLLRFNQRIIAFSLLMDVMIIATMSIPNSFVYIQFHPLAYLVKLNIEMTMANLIKRIAVSSSRRTGNAALVEEFASSNFSSSGAKSSATRSHARRSSIIELRAHMSATKSKAKTHKHGKPSKDAGSENASHGSHGSSGDHGPKGPRAISFAPNEIRVTEDFHVVSEPLPEYAQGMEYGKSEVEIAGVEGKSEGGSVVKSRSLDDITEGGESVKSGGQGGGGDSDDEAALVRGREHGHGHGHGGWERLR